LPAMVERWTIEARRGAAAMASRMRVAAFHRGCAVVGCARRPFFGTTAQADVVVGRQVPPSSVLHDRTIQESTTRVLRLIGGSQRTPPQARN
jgi:hypothetical protein